MHKERIVQDLIDIKKDLKRNEAELNELETLEQETEALLNNSSLEANDELSKMNSDAKSLREKIKNLVEGNIEE